jgi:hypothetical protein
MKIHPDQIEGVRQSQDQARTNRTAEPGQAFGDILGEEVSKAGTTQAASAAPPPPGIQAMHPLFATQAVAEVDATAAEGEAVAQVERTLDSLETYAGILGDTGSGSLREAYAALENLQSDVADLKGMAAGHPGLQDVADELEVLATTEQIKFNRGDYL